MIRILPVVLFLMVSFYTFGQKNGDSSFKNYELKIPRSEFIYRMVAIPGGRFRMGELKGKAAPASKAGQLLEVSPFWIGAFEVTHDQFGIFFKDESISQGSKVDAVTRPTAQYIDLSWNMGKEGGFPVNSMSQDAALMFCRWLYRNTGIFYRLPTEAEWEYACRAGSIGTYYFGDNPNHLDQYAWFKKNSGNKYHKVGQKKPNAWGLYDMLGNVSEWVLDQYDEDYFNTIGPHPKDPLIQPSSRYPRSVRGGSYEDDADRLGVAVRGHSEAAWNKRDPQMPKSRWWLTDASFVGFRILRPLHQPTPEEAEKFFKLYLGK